MATPKIVPTYDNFEVFLKAGENARTVYPDNDKCVALHDEEHFQIIVNNKLNRKIIVNYTLSGTDLGDLVIPPHVCAEIDRPINPELPARKFQFVKFGGDLANQVCASSNKVNSDEIRVTIKPEIVKKSKQTPYTLETDFSGPFAFQGSVLAACATASPKFAAASSNKKDLGGFGSVININDEVDNSGTNESSKNKGCAILSATQSTQKFKPCSLFETEGVFYYVMFLREAATRIPLRIEDAFGIED